MTTLTGVPVSPGRVAGTVVTMPAPVPEPEAVPLAPDADVEAVASSIAAAAARVQEDLFARAAAASGTAAEVLTVTAAMAADPALATGAANEVRASWITPARAVWETAGQVATQLESLGGYMAERARDVLDVRDRIVAELLGLRAPGVPDPGHPFVLVAVDLAPADTATLDPSRVQAIVTAGGGPTSHTAILARSLGIPAVVAAAGAEALVDDTLVLVDGGTGTVTVDPTPEQVEAAQRTASTVRTFDGIGRTADGHRVQLLANVADPEAAKAGVEANAEGVGLFRTEFCFLGRAEEPSVDEQVAAYRGVLDAFGGKKVVLRTLDAGADKPLPFVTADDEPNPALGVRGLRTSWAHPDVLDRQLEAIAQAARAPAGGAGRAAAGAGAGDGSADPAGAEAGADQAGVEATGIDSWQPADVWVMAPMVATVDEAKSFVEACEKHGLHQAGVMIEVPAAALQSRWIFEHAKFGSLGTNDLTQYAMAADRELGDLARLSTPWQPAVLQLIEAACAGGAAYAAVHGKAASADTATHGEAASTHGTTVEHRGAQTADATRPVETATAERPVGVCGEAAADPALAPVLVGLGVASLSMTPRAIADVAAVLAATTYDECVALAELALNQPSAEAARAAVRDHLPILAELGL